ncbi:MAG TPA: hypothetical protein VE344_09970 [Methylomirabilota bacterium]|nr:hypothetical protein [Methylomirabilota bacterium]
MFVHAIALLLSVCALAEMRRHERQIISRFIERGKQQIPESLKTNKEDEASLRSALHGSKVSLWIIAVFCAIDIIHGLFFV